MGSGHGHRTIGIGQKTLLSPNAPFLHDVRCAASLLQNCADPRKCLHWFFCHNKAKISKQGSMCYNAPWKIRPRQSMEKINALLFTSEKNFGFSYAPLLAACFSGKTFLSLPAGQTQLQGSRCVDELATSTAQGSPAFHPASAAHLTRKITKQIKKTWPCHLWLDRAGLTLKVAWDPKEETPAAT